MAVASRSLWDRLLPFAGIAGFLGIWWWRTGAMGTSLVPGPWAVALAIGQLAAKGTLWKHLVASLFRVSWGFGLGAGVGIPLGLALAWFPRSERALNPFVQIMRPISPLAWTPIAILWFGVGDVPAIFIIFLGTLLPVTVTAMNAVSSVDQTHINVGRNFGLSSWRIITRVVLPSAWPQLLNGLRLTLGIAWLVVVAAEMLAVTSGLGFLIIDSRNAGDRYDIVVAGMVLIGLTGLALDAFMKSVISRTSRRQAKPAGKP
ncbi:MAG TPA: ABC transporter permease [Planctomycetota bacterium]|nr:ABC transporter permease [Planctomycetota bacterium]